MRKAPSKKPKKNTKPWSAAITTNGTRVFLGSFASENEAARAYDVAAKHYHGEFAALNFPEKEIAKLQNSYCKLSAPHTMLRTVMNELPRSKSEFTVFFLVCLGIGISLTCLLIAAITYIQ